MKKNAQANDLTKKAAVRQWAEKETFWQWKNNHIYRQARQLNGPSQIRVFKMINLNKPQIRF